MLDVDISRGSWRAREGASVRRSVGRSRKLCLPQMLWLGSCACSKRVIPLITSEESHSCVCVWTLQHAHTLEVAIKLLHASPGAVIYADSAGLNVPTFRHVYATDVRERENVCAKLMASFRHLERHGLGTLQLQPGAWPVFIMHRWSLRSVEAQATLRRWGIPLHFFHGYLEAATLHYAGPCADTCDAAETSVPAPTCRATKGTDVTQEQSAVPTSSAPDQVPEGAEQLASKQKKPAAGSTWRTVYSQLHEERPQTLQAATLLARRACQAADPPCSITCRTKRAVQESGCAGYKLWGSCAECRPACDIKVSAVWIPWHPDLGSRSDQGLITNPPLVIKVSAAGVAWHPHLGSRRALITEPLRRPACHLGSRSGQGLITNPPLVIKVSTAWMPWHPDLGSRRAFITEPLRRPACHLGSRSGQGLITNPPLVIKVSTAWMPWHPDLGSRSGQGLITNPPLVIKVSTAWTPWHPDLNSRRDQGLITNPPLVIKVSTAWMPWHPDLGSRDDQGLITNPPW